MTKAPIILLGYQRSGTTALAHVLQQAVAQEGGLFTNNGKLLYYLHRWLTPEDVDARHFRFDEIQHALRRVHPYGQEQKTTEWLERADTALADAAEAIWRNTLPPRAHLEIAKRIVTAAYARWPIWGEKYNECMLDIAYLEAVLERPRYVFVFRNPVAVSFSMMNWCQGKRWNPMTRKEAIEKWVRWNTLTIDGLARVDPKRILYVEYSPDLLSSAFRKKLGAFTELSLDELCFAKFSPTAPSEEPNRGRSKQLLRQLRELTE
ncbi:sulfotransferase (plasmid) [Phaeobacter sp. BS23]|uniref:sulfotransferase n=1 Tax=Phaeobacter sp. BS23 TaxID=2907239 RepID=UPI003703EDAB